MQGGSVIHGRNTTPGGHVNPAHPQARDNRAIPGKAATTDGRTPGATRTPNVHVTDVRSATRNRNTMRDPSVMRDRSAMRDPTAMRDSNAM